MQLVEDLLARIQRLIESRPRGKAPLEWQVEAFGAGDLAALAALASLAARSADQEALIVRELTAPRDCVYQAWTTPELVKRWWGGRRGVVTAAEVDLRVGGKWRYVLAADDGREIVFRGRYQEIVPSHRIVSTEVPQTMPEYSNSKTVMFTDLGPRTRVSLLMDFPSTDARNRAVDAGIGGWAEEQLDLLESVATSLS